MSSGLVLVIDDDEWVGRLLAVALREAGYEVITAILANEGFEKAVEMQPDCIVCDVDLPDENGFWVARNIRSHPTTVSVCPFLFLSGLDDREHRLEGFQVGGDVYLTKPFRIDEVVAQVGALLQMADRMRASRGPVPSIPPPTMEAAMVGDLSQVSIATVLTLLDMERRSGRLEVTSGSEKAMFVVSSGNITQAKHAGEVREPLDLIRAVLAWKKGRFTFKPDAEDAGHMQNSSINALLMEAVRLEDELRVARPISSSAPPVRTGPVSPRVAMPASVRTRTPLAMPKVVKVNHTATPKTNLAAAEREATPSSPTADEPPPSSIPISIAMDAVEDRELESGWSSLPPRGAAEDAPAPLPAMAMQPAPKIALEIASPPSAVTPPASPAFPANDERLSPLRQLRVPTPPKPRTSSNDK